MTTNTSMNTLTGKVAMVTGASRGIGAAIAKRLAQDGAAVAITYLGAHTKADEVAGRRAVAIRADSADADAVKQSVAETVRSLGRLDVLVNNAGVVVASPLDKFALGDFDRMIAVNVRGVFVAAQEAARHMVDGGRIITIGSGNADRRPFEGGGVYAMTKAAVAGLTRGLARDLGPRGITVNNVQPGPVDTDMNPANGPFAETLKSFMALKRYGQGAEIAGLVSYLAGSEASFITGASLTIDGGFSA
jgi:3-oxoacyl-[acyl-carrier protein] reductase